jgi:hypothetical protein
LLSQRPIELIRAGRRNLGLNLFYTDDCPASFEPLGFTSCIDDHLSFPGDQGLARKSEEGSILVAGAHRIGVVLSHVASAEGEEQLYVIPKDVNYSLKRSRLDEYMVSTEEAASPNVTASSQPFHVSSPPLPPTDAMASPAAPSTQTRDDIATRDALQQMQRSSSRPGELIPTQTLVDANDLDADDSSLPDQSYSNALHSHNQAGKRPQRVILRTKVAELIIHVRAVLERCPTSDRIFDQRALDNCKIKRKVQSDMVNCECMDNKNRGTMVCHTHGSYAPDLANENSFSVRCVAHGSTSIATAGMKSKKTTVPLSISVTTAFCCRKRRTLTIGCPFSLNAETRFGTFTRMGSPLETT